MIRHLFFYFLFMSKEKVTHDEKNSHENHHKNHGNDTTHTHNKNISENHHHDEVHVKKVVTEETTSDMVVTDSTDEYVTPMADKKTTESEIHTKNYTRNEGEIHTDAYVNEAANQEKPRTWLDILKYILTGLILLGVISLIGWILYGKMTGPLKAVVYEAGADQAYEFAIDGKTYKVPTDKMYIDIEGLGRGKHTVSVNGKEVGTFERGWFDEGAIINPNLEKFVEADIIYSTDPEKYKDKLQNNKITIEGMEFEGPYRLVEGLYIKKSWDYAPWEASPETVRTKGNYTIKQELFTAYDFVMGSLSPEEKAKLFSESGSEITPETPVQPAVIGPEMATATGSAQ